jgi:hypothetical protein
MHIKKRLFRNWYVIQQGDGYGSRYYHIHWSEINEYPRENLYGPFWTMIGAKNKSDELTDKHYHQVFGGS